MNLNDRGGINEGISRNVWMNFGRERKLREHPYAQGFMKA
jgi:hypothetical protein